LPAIERQRDPKMAGEHLAAAVREAGLLALSTFRTPVKSWLKDNSSPVSEADVAADRLLRARLLAPDPTVGWLSEESEDDCARISARQVYIVDPIDGTRAYLAGLPDWSVSAALVEEGRPVAAAIFAPARDEMFTAVAGQGAWRNGAKVEVSAGNALAGARVAGPRGFLDRLDGTGAGLVAVPKVHSLALRLAWVAAGQLDAAFASGNSHDWDLAAADLLVHEAGGTLTTFTSRYLTYNRSRPVHGALIAAGLGRHVALINLLQDQRIELV
jgi:myo-inositol-1(or 4)-monophosphatase